MKYILLFFCILSLSCKYNVANPVGTLKDYTAGSGKIYYVSSGAEVPEIVETLRKNKHSLGKYLIKVDATNDTTDAKTNILTNIASALKNNSSFNNVEVDISKLIGIKEIPKEIFKDLKNLSSIILSDEVTKIEKEAFAGCSSLTNVRFSKELTNIGNGAFSNCSALTFISLDSEQKLTISSNAFDGCYSLVNLVLPKSIEKVDGDTFKNCSQLKNVEYLGTTNVSGTNVFSSGSNPTNLYLPNLGTNKTDGFTNFLGGSWNINPNGNKHIPS